MKHQTQGFVGRGTVTWGSILNCKQEDGEDPGVFLTRMETKIKHWVDVF